MFRLPRMNLGRPHGFLHGKTAGEYTFIVVDITVTKLFRYKGTYETKKAYLIECTSKS